jgi:hypothetical protein
MVITTNKQVCFSGEEGGVKALEREADHISSSGVDVIYGYSRPFPCYTFMT